MLLITYLFQEALVLIDQNAQRKPQKEIVLGFIYGHEHHPLVGFVC